jgi:hypothetical protein
MYLVAIGETGNEGHCSWENVGCCASVVRKWLVAPESRIAHCLMLAALVVMVLSRMEAANAKLWVGVG